MSNTETAKLQARFERLKDNGLVDLKFYTGEVSEATPESFCKEANELLDAIEAGKARRFTFGDSSHAA